MTHVELFAGIGGIGIAAGWAGFKTIVQVEIDPYCQRVLEKHWPEVHRVADIRDFPDRDYGTVTLVSGGFPCQPVSSAGKRRSRKDDRWLWPEMLRVIRTLVPRWVLAENVPGLLSIEQGVVFETVLADLERAGYTTQAVVVPAAGVGAPHLRYRVFVVAHAKYAKTTRQREYSGQGLSITESNRLGESSTDVPDSSGQRWREERAESTATRETGIGGDCGNPIRTGLAQREGQSGNDGPQLPALIGADWWSVEPQLGRVASGISHRVDRLRCLGNAVVPQQVYPILQAIAEVERSEVRN